MKFHWAAAGTLVSASNSKVEDQKIQQNHATGVTNERAFSFPEEDESLSKKTAQILFSNTVQQKQALSWYPGKNGLLKNIVDRSHQVQAVGAPCEPNQSIDADVGVLGCDDGFLCKESPSHDGDYYCVADQALHSSRRLEDEEDCDYSDYDYGTGLGTVVCTYSPDICGEYGLPENTCARLIISVTFDNPEDTYEYDAEACYNLFEGEYDADGDIVKMCALRGSEDDPYDDSCSLLVEGDSCSTCTLIDAGTSDGCFKADCSNTCAGGEIDFCDTDDYFSEVLSCFGGGGGGDGAFGSFHSTTLSSSLALAGVAAGAFAAWF